MNRDQNIIALGYLGLLVAVGVVAGIYTGWIGGLVCSVIYLIAGGFWIRYREQRY